ncbi:Bbp16 family capsid cement protein [Sphaerisporangium sp. NPDC049003]|uniref:Bbp16 family capsid cement protein n=1 Tax=Sphaerisporangium sp. NPDC049003 TaxID=3364517 RepID=UPI003724BDE0
MSRLDNVNDISIAASLVPAARTTTANGTGVDLAGYNAAAVVICAGVITDGTLYTFEVQESDDNATFTAVADADLIGTEPALAASDDNAVRELGYKGIKRYIRVALATVTGSPATGGVFAAFVVRGKPRKSPA